MIFRDQSLLQLQIGIALVILSGACGSERNAQGNPPVIQKATEVYGPLIIPLQNLKPTQGISISATYSATAKVRPWSGWWYPYNEKLLFSGLLSPVENPRKKPTLSPLERFDEYIKRMEGSDPKTAEFERSHLYQVDCDPSNGLCGGVAVASVLYPEPVSPIESHGVLFRTVDLKALLTKAYENVDGLTQFGNRFAVLGRDDPDDIYPDEFHRILLGEIFEKKLPFIMDHDLGPAIWQVVVWKTSIHYELQLRKEKQDADVLHVHTWVHTSDSRFRDQNMPPEKIPDYQGTYDLQRDYTYDLIGDWDEVSGRFQSRRGIWTDHSKIDHPDFVLVIPSKKDEAGEYQFDTKRLSHRSLNANFNDKLDQVTALVSQRP